MDPGKGEALARAQGFITRGFMVATLLTGATLGLVWAAQSRKIPKGAWVMGMGILLVLDLGRVDDAFIQTMDFHEWAAADPNTRYLLERKDTEDPFKVLAMGGQVGFGQDNMPGMHGLELAAGHHPNDLARYRELIGMVGSGVPANLFDTETGGPNLQLLSILNVRYVIWPVYRFGGLPAGDPVMATRLGGEGVFEAVYEIPTLPRARLVGEAVVLSDDKAVPYLLSPNFRPAEEVVLAEDSPIRLPGGPVDGEVHWVEKGPNRLRLRVRSDSPALLVLAENWYPAWKAVVRGEETPVLRANHTLRAIPVPPGESEVELFFDAGTLRGPLLISLGSLALLGMAAFFRGGEERKEAEGGEGAP
jgi:hypothetical protein